MYVFIYLSEMNTNEQYQILIFVFTQEINQFKLNNKPNNTPNLTMYIHSLIRFYIKS